MNRLQNVSPVRQNTTGLPLRVRVHPALLEALLPNPASPLVDGLEPGERRRLVAVWKSETARVRAGQAILLQSLGALAMTTVFQRADRNSLDIAHLPFSYKGPEGRASCTLSAKVTAGGVLHVEVCAWEGNAPAVTFGAREMAATLERNRKRARR